MCRNHAGVSWVDPTGVTDVIGGALDISEGNYLAGALRMGSGLVPFSQSTLGCGAAGTLNKAVNLGEAGMGINDGIQSLRNDDPMGAAMSFLGAGMSMGGMGQSFCFVAGTQVVVEILDDGTATLEDAVPTEAGPNSDPFLGNFVLAVALVAVAFEGRRRISRTRRRTDQSTNECEETKEHKDLDAAFVNWDWQLHIGEPDSQAPAPAEDLYVNRRGQPETDPTEGSTLVSSPPTEPMLPSADSPQTTSPATLANSSMPTPTTRVDSQPEPVRTGTFRQLTATLWLAAFLSLAGWFGYRALPDQPTAAASTTARATPSAASGKPRYVTKNIEDVKAGEKVLAMDPASGELAYKRVVADFSLVADHLRILKIVADDGSDQILQTTDEHPFWLPARDAWVAAKHLTPGDLVLGPHGQLQSVAATSREEYPNGIPVFNFEVEHFHSYFVRESAADIPFLSHNAAKTPTGSSCAPTHDTGKMGRVGEHAAQDAVSEYLGRTPIGGTNITYKGAVQNGSGHGLDLVYEYDDPTGKRMTAVVEVKVNSSRLSEDQKDSEEFVRSRAERANGWSVSADIKKLAKEVLVADKAGLIMYLLVRVKWTGKSKIVVEPWVTQWRRSRVRQMLCEDFAHGLKNMTPSGCTRACQTTLAAAARRGSSAFQWVRSNIGQEPVQST